jgi:hypothetical protein
LLDIIINKTILTAVMSAPLPHDEEQRWLKVVRELLSGLRFGVVQIVVQDAKVVQVEKTEKVRISPQ